MNTLKGDVAHGNKKQENIICKTWDLIIFIILIIHKSGKHITHRLVFRTSSGRQLIT